jgi:Na+/H+ antiporter NhaA
LDGDWCRSCARHRQALILWILFLVLPLFAFGACTVGVLSTIGPSYNGSLDWLFQVAAGIVVGSPIVGILYAIFRRKN